MATRYKILSARELKTDLIDNSDSFIASQKAVKTAVDAKMANPMTTEGDVVYGGASGAPTRLAKGTAGQVLQMNAGATAPEWGTASGGGGDWTELANVTLASAATSLASGTITGKQALKIIIHVVNLAASDNIRINFNSDTGNNYGYRDFATFSTSNAVSDWSYMPLTMSTTSTSIMIVIDIFNKSDVRKPVIVSSTICGANSAAPNSYDVKGVWNNTSAQITSVTISTSAQNMGAGTRMLVYGSKS